MNVDAKKTAARLKKLTSLRPTLAIVLGSGFQEVLSDLELENEIPYESLPGFPPVGVAGHAGNLLAGRLGGVPMFVLSGRSHYYEGHLMAEITFAVRMVADFGVHTLVLTNAAGGIN
ncbi:MAG: purine-nucleoside phosphorylase, partial [Pedosphaera parvula]|nr:purine-nucleoside phosphorylase [Pedosphaera parvula]